MFILPGIIVVLSLATTALVTHDANGPYGHGSCQSVEKSQVSR